MEVELPDIWLLIPHLRSSASEQFSRAEGSKLLLAVAMADEYRIRLLGSQFEIIDDAGDRVGASQTEREAKHEIDVLVSDDSMWKSARMLVQAAVSALMN